MKFMLAREESKLILVSRTVPINCVMPNFRIYPVFTSKVRHYLNFTSCEAGLFIYGSNGKFWMFLKQKYFFLRIKGRMSVILAD